MTRHLNNTPAAKALGIALLVLLMFPVLKLVEHQIVERSHYRDTAVDEISQHWGAEQTLFGPFLTIPFSHTVRIDNKATTVHNELSLMPATLKIDGHLAPELRHRGIYQVPVYNAKLALTGRFAKLEPSLFPDGARIHWQRATLSLVLSDARALRTQPAIQFGNKALQFADSARSTRMPGTRLFARLVDAKTQLQTGQDFSLSIEAGGSRRLLIVPAADETQVRLQSPWPDPSFIGAALPSKRAIGVQGFDAQWRQLSLGRGFPRDWTEPNSHYQSIAQSAFGVALYQPVDLYRLNERAIKYALLLIILIFSATFLIDTLNAQRLHLMNHLLVGAALALFFLLLLALGEHIGFAPAFALSAATATVMIGGYSGATLQSRRGGLWVALSLAMTFGAIYVMLNAEQYALLFGTVLLVALLGAIMYSTRRLDWRRAAAASPPPDPAYRP